ncbi:MAG: hypothetical protein AAF926_02910 [Pseudomonadota bacterium]
MRLAILAISAAALTGCSWYGSQSHYGTPPHMAGCQTAASGQGGMQGYQHMSYGYGGTVGCQTGAYGQTGHYGAGQAYQPYGATGYGFQTYGAQSMAGQGMAGQGVIGQGFAGQNYAGQSFAAQGLTVQGQGVGGFQQPVTTLGATAPFGAALTTQAGGAFAGGAVAGGGVQTVVGAPIYVPQPYPAPYGVPQLRGPVCCGVTGGGGAGMPFGVELFVGTELDSSGKLFTKKSSGPPDGDTSIGIRVGEIEPISYDDAFGTPTTIGGALSYDVSRNTTVLGAISTSSAEGQTVTNYTTVQPGTWAGTTFTPDAGSTERGLDGTFSDLDLTTVEAGVRQYVGHDPAFRPYVAATAGITHNNDVEFVQTYNDDGTFYGQRRFIDAGWSPTASAVLGTELALSPRAAIGVEAGVRWRDNMDSAADSEDRITIPLTLRGRLAF